MSGSRQGFFESDEAYRERIAREAMEETIREATGSSPRQGIFESDEDYGDRLEREADEATIEDLKGVAPSQGIFESDSAYDERVSQEADEEVVRDHTGDSPRQGFFESDDDYRDRVEREADEAIIEQATGSAPSQGFFESDDDYQERISEEADEHRADDNASGGCFITTACVEFAGLPDDCRELTVLRRFRDHYLALLPDGKSMIGEYYRVAPSIVMGMLATPDRHEVLEAAWLSIREAVVEVEAGRNGVALEIYRSLFEDLRSRFAVAGRVAR